MSFLCKLGIHKWINWQHKVGRKILVRTKTYRAQAYQMRQCKVCGIKQIKWDGGFLG